MIRTGYNRRQALIRLLRFWVRGLSAPYEGAVFVDNRQL